MDDGNHGINPETSERMGNRWPGTCNYPDCGKEIDHGVNYVCGGKHKGGKYGCGRYFCTYHLVITPIAVLCLICGEKHYPAQEPVDRKTWKNIKREK